MRLSTARKILNEREKFKIYCNCGHGVVILPFEHKRKKICSYCGKYVYANKHEEFRERLGVLL